MNILQISVTDHGGGAERVAWMLHRTFMERGHQSHLAVGHKYSDDPGVIEIDNAGHANLMHKIKARIADELGIQYVSHPGSHHLVEEVPPFDIVHAHNLHSDYFDLAALKRLTPRAPVILNMQDMWLITGHCAHPLGSERWRDGCGACPHLMTYPAIQRDATRFNLARKRRLLDQTPVVVSSPGRWLLELVDRSYLAEKPRRHIPNPVDRDVFRPAEAGRAREALGLDGMRPIVLFPARYAPDSSFKDFDLFVLMIDRLNAGPWKPLGIAFGDEEGGLAASDHVRLIPPVSDEMLVASYYQAADVVVYPSKAETAPLGVIEGLASGTPVVATAVGGIPEMLKHRRNGLLVAPGDLDGFCGAVQMLLEEPELAAELGRNGLEDAAEFDLQRVATQWLDWYQELIEDFQRPEMESPRRGPGLGS